MNSKKCVYFDNDPTMHLRANTYELIILMRCAIIENIAIEQISNIIVTRRRHDI